MLHRNAALTVGRRRQLAERSRQGVSTRQLAREFNCSHSCAGAWAERGQDPEETFADKSSRPHSSPGQTPEHVEALIVAERLREPAPRSHERRWPGPDAIADKLRRPASTCYSVLRRYGLNRRPERDERLEPKLPTKRYQWALPGQMLHIDVKKLGRFDRPGHATRGRSPENRNAGVGWAYLFVAVDDASRVAYAAFMPDETKESAVAFLKRARRFYAHAGIRRLERVLTDNGSCFRSRVWAAACHELGARACHTRPYRPQTNGKVERLIRTLLEEWAYAREYGSDDERQRALPGYLYYFNHQRHHQGLGGLTPLEAVRNVSEEYS